MRSLEVGKVYKQLNTGRKEFVLSKQFLFPGTLMGAGEHEAVECKSRADCVHKTAVALKEARETGYWIHLLQDAEELNKHSKELVSNLTALIKTTKTMYFFRKVVFLWLRGDCENQE